ncbi:cation diffusion facilitator family transporter [Ruminococcus sp. OA3]|uniref:cation diffusion facilitator family transporter n=1 Tax=Ruminococcus sp. OA3 TaxID=2914164 RepID=UPI001F06A43B|nr:cation diffusion facilitator family transporter [Ruminococcus sp. OA3]MCH1984369.1 cation diffusion facilitator family transporter [Ruminococcus sp. OA3]
MTGEKSRQDQGRKTSIFMAVGNMCLFIGYFIIGTAGNSISVISEGVDNLIDACSSLLLLLGFKISGRGKDSRHPNGHGRIEYIIGLLISEMILFAAVILAKESVKRLVHPEPVGALLPILLAAVIGAGVKLVLVYYIKKQNRELKSPALDAYQKNELADLKGIILVAVSPILQHFTALPIDGIAGMVIAVMIAADGVKSFMKNVSLLLGEGLDKEETEEIKQLLSCYGDAVKLESFEFHDYGPEEKEGIMVLSICPGILHGDLQRIIGDCKEQIKNRLNIHVTVYVNLNNARVTDKTYAVQPHLGGVRQYLRLLTVNMGRGKRQYGIR